MVFQKGNRAWKLRKKPVIDTTIMIPCACGCGQMIHKYDYQKKIRKYAPYHYFRTIEFSKNQSNLMKNRIISEKTIEKMRTHQLGKNNTFYGKTHSEENKNKHRKLVKKLWQDPSYAKRVIENTLKSLLKRPTSFEHRISDLCIKHNFPFFYTGDGTFIIGHKNPDFRHKNLPIVIEVYNNFHHPKNYEQERGEYFAKYGYKTIFINEGEVTAKNWEEVCVNKMFKKLKGGDEEWEGLK